MKMSTDRYNLATTSKPLASGCCGSILINSTNEPWEPDTLTLHDGDIYNIYVDSYRPDHFHYHWTSHGEPTLSEQETQLEFEDSADDESYSFLLFVLTMNLSFREIYSHRSSNRCYTSATAFLFPYFSTKQSRRRIVLK